MMFKKSEGEIMTTVHSHILSLSVIFFLIALILPTVIKALANQVKEKKNRTKNLMILLFGSLGISAQAQDASTSAASGSTP